MAIASNLGYPRLGHRRQLKQAVEKYWSGKLSAEELLQEGQAIKVKNWQLQKSAGIKHIPSNDFSFYDHVLDAAITFGVIPHRYPSLSSIDGKKNIAVDEADVKDVQKKNLDLYFHLARGCAKDNCQLHPGKTIPALEMTKWFDTNYHYIVPELEENQKFELAATPKVVQEFLEAKAIDIYTRPVILGPVSFLLLAKTHGSASDCWAYLPDLLKAYSDLFEHLKIAGADWVQIDEPCLVLDLEPQTKAAYQKAYEYLAKNDLKLLLTTYFGSLGENLPFALTLPTDGIHLDFVLGDDFAELAKGWPKNKVLSAGVVDGRNVWANNLEDTLHLLKQLEKIVGNHNLLVAPSCSLMHVPPDLDDEENLDGQIGKWLAFAKQKLDEVSLLANVLNEKIGQAEKKKIDAAFEANKKVVADRKESTRVYNADLRSQLAKISEELLKRKTPFAQRKIAQEGVINLPLLPATTIGSFPQTKEIRQARAEYKAGKIDRKQYEKIMHEEIKHAIAVQDEVGLDVLVHGEAERNDMVEYFAEFLDGYIFTEHGWVQSYGSRCVKPPIIFGDIIRKKQMTVPWSVYAQSEANLLPSRRPVKGMLTGPVTMLQWSFVRNDQSLAETCKQLAWAIREEVLDLEKNGIKIIQIDEPAIREGLPLKKANWQHYLKWAVDSFRLASSSVKDETQIHTHMCYSEFNDIIEAVAALDADVVSIEAARSQLDLLSAFVKFKYPNDIGPGLFDIHSPRVPPESEMVDLLQKALSVIAAKQLWVNPDCGLKTRAWEEVIPALKNMVGAAKFMRAKLQEKEAISVQ